MPFLPLEKLDLLMGGAVQERFRIALAEVLANIRDPNTRATEKRSITLTLTLAPYATRDTAQMDVTVKTKLAAAAPAETTDGLSGLQRRRPGHRLGKGGPDPRPDRHGRPRSADAEHRHL